MNDSIIKSNPIIAIVIPCYNEAQALPKTTEIIKSILQKLKNEGEININSYILCVDDGSYDKTWDVIGNLHAQDPLIKGISLTKNCGHQYALLAGLMTAKENADAVVSIDADMQDDPTVIENMIKLYSEGNEIIYGVRKSRALDSWFKRNSARAFYKFQNLMGLKTIYDHADYRLMSKRALEILSQYNEQNLFLRGIIPLIGLKSTTVQYDRNERIAGESKYPLSKMLAFSIDGITSFSAKPMRWIFILGVLLFFADIIVAVYVLISYFSGETVSGWSSIMISIWFFGSVLLMGIGILGEYIGKIFVETKHRPRYNIMDSIG